MCPVDRPSSSRPLSARCQPGTPSSQPAYPRYRLLIGKPSCPTPRSCPVQVTELAAQPQSQRCRSMTTGTGAMPQVAQRTREAMPAEQFHAIRHRSQPSVVHCHSCCHVRGNLRRQGTTSTQLDTSDRLLFPPGSTLRRLFAAMLFFLLSVCSLIIHVSSTFFSLIAAYKKIFSGEVTEEKKNYQSRPTAPSLSTPPPPTSTPLSNHSKL